MQTFLRVGGLTSIDSGSTNRGVYMEGDGDILFNLVHLNTYRLS